MSDPLQNPVWHSLHGEHARFAERTGDAVRYAPDVAPFLGLPEEPDPAAWADAAKLVGPGGEAVITGDSRTAPAGWEAFEDLPGVQMVDDGVVGAPEPEAVRLTTDDVPEMRDLVRRTKPGPFVDRTVELGTYLGIRHDGRLVAMAGERMRPPGWCEISAVCTDPAFRGRGLASRLVKALVHEVRAHGEQPFLHAVAGNTGAIALYERMGFRIHRRPRFRALRAPA
ncbi:GNAT family N-acetyltransferase [Saccharopolyspora rhizosphaerae]|uniref:GNAT family N-acetyltransferase n=1 Tax=Saccharopolyspora rhizosphaerae TaxID=2492662 RepID=A0A426K388_9PSEU|nr:GNAT family N-acetyltransferase [Saccharopolyspora rhizosphaerae]RRO19925.1 GNAT family N-acetyltransferase [Saccharopolyspora rhizosphaerae]